jgi:long-chain acyl-CoA synthetase
VRAPRLAASAVLVAATLIMASRVGAATAPTDPRRPHPVLLVTLDVDEAFAWARSVGLPEDLALLAQDASLRAVIQSAVDEANAGYAPPERVRAFAVLERPFSIDDGELTPTLKVRRTVVAEHFADVIDSLYR